MHSSGKNLPIRMGRSHCHHNADPHISKEDWGMTDNSQATNPKDLVGVHKPALCLIPQSASIQEAIVLGLGARKYGSAFNWRKHRVQASIYVSAAMRHLAQWFDGEDNDSESGVSHLAHARACLGILLDAIATGHVIDDRPPNGAASALIKKHTRKRTRRQG